jgi:ABC-type Mn2+/Zn2+ transport system permease subunit
MKKIALVSPIIGAATCVAGLMFSLFLDLPVGSCIVLVSTFAFALAVLLSPKRKREEVKS